MRRGTIIFGNKITVYFNFPLFVRFLEHSPTNLLKKENNKITIANNKINGYLRQIETISTPGT